MRGLSLAIFPNAQSVIAQDLLKKRKQEARCARVLPAKMKAGHAKGKPFSGLSLLNTKNRDSTAGNTMEEFSWWALWWTQRKQNSLLSSKNVSIYLRKWYVGCMRGMLEAVAMH